MLSRPPASSFATLLPVLLATLVTLSTAYLTKQGCFALGFLDSPYCHSDYGPVYVARELADARFPYGVPALEYPAGLGLILWLASALGGSAVGFVRVSMLFSTVACIAIVSILWRETGRRAWLFAAAPTVALYAFLNWDLIGLVFAIAAIAAFVRRRNAWSGIWLGVGAAIKIFPLLLLVPMVAERWRERERSQAARLLLGAAASLIALNTPIAWASFDGWAFFLRFNSARVVDWGTLWSAGCQTSGSDLCNNIPLVNALSFLAFAAGSILVWLVVTRRAPTLPRWRMSFPLIIVLFLTSKVFSPQYSLWILPWFALVLPDVRLFLAYEAVDIGIYVTTFAWQQRLTGSGGWPLWPLNLFILARAIVLIMMLVTFARRAARVAEHQTIGVPATRI